MIPENPVKLIAWLDFSIRFSLLRLRDRRVRRKESALNGCFFCFPQYNELGLNRVGGDRVNEILRTGKAAQGFASPVFV